MAKDKVLSSGSTRRWWESNHDKRLLFGIDYTRFLCCNLFGCITTEKLEPYFEIKVFTLVDIKFVEVDRFADKVGFKFASCNHNGCVFAGRNTLMYRPCEGLTKNTKMPTRFENDSTLLRRWTNDSQWTIQLKDEDISVVAMGSSWIAAFTDRNMIRIFTPSGLQIHIISLDKQSESVYTVAGFGDKLVVLTNPINNSNPNKLIFRLYDVSNETLLTTGDLVLPSGSKLRWVGFSLDGKPTIYDSQGVLLVFDGVSWLPLFSAYKASRYKEEKHKDRPEKYWVIGLDSTRMFYIFCRFHQCEPEAKNVSTDIFVASRDFAGTSSGTPNEIGGHSTQFHCIKDKAPLMESLESVQNGEERFLCYNAHGTMTTKKDGQYFHLEVKFHDTNREQRTYRITEESCFSIGIMNDNATVYANLPKGEENKITVMYRSFQSWNNNWSFCFEEEVKSLALGNSWVAVVTDKRVRVYADDSVAMYSMSLVPDETIVTTAGYGDELAVVVSTFTSDEEQMLGFRVYDVSNELRETRGGLQLTPDSQLVWFGYSKEGKLCSFDSEGVLRFFSDHSGGTWLKIYSASTLKKENEHYWVVGLDSAKLFYIFWNVRQDYREAQNVSPLLVSDIDYAGPYPKNKVDGPILFRSTQFYRIKHKGPVMESLQSVATPAQIGEARFLCYNSWGAMTIRKDGHYFHLEVRFRNTRDLRTYTDKSGFSMGIMNDKGAVFANLPKGGENKSTLMYCPFPNLDNNDEWSLCFDEELKSLALGNSWVAVTTDKSLRVYTDDGVAMYSMSLDQLIPDETIVTTAGYGDELAVIVSSSTSNEEQMLGICVYDVYNEFKETRGGLQITPDSRLVWFGYSKEGKLCLFDSEGVLRVFSNHFGGTWLQIFSASKKLKKEKKYYWVVGLESTSLSCVFCKSPYQFPEVFPDPVINTLQLSVPVASSDIHATNFESDFILYRMNLSSILRKAQETKSADEATLALDECILSLFSTCYKAKKWLRAYELVKLLSSEESKKIAMGRVIEAKLPDLAHEIKLLLTPRDEP